MINEGVRYAHDHGMAKWRSIRSINVLAGPIHLSIRLVNGQELINNSPAKKYFGPTR